MTSRNDAATSILCPSHYQMLTEGSGIIEAVIDTRGYFTATKKTQLKELGFTTSQIRVPALVIPVHNVHGEIATYQARPDQPRINKGKAIKYETCFGKSMVLDVPPSSRQYLGDPNKPLFVTEGIKKGDALASHGCCVVALLGVWNWRGTNHHGGKVALPDWEQVALNNRRVYIVFDSDVMTKTQVHHALARLKMFLESRGAQVELIYLPTKDDGDKQGVDDFLAADRDITALLSLATPHLHELDPEDRDDLNVPYRSTPRGLIWFKDTRDGLISVPLTNFTAEIVEDALVDDGAETWRIFTIRTTLGHRIMTFDVPALRFGSMQWATEHLGAEALIFPGQTIREHARAAVQSLSTNIVESHIYAHLGWRKIDVRWVYLHAAGAIGQDGQVAETTVQVNDALSRHVLPAPANADDLMKAVRASLEILKLAPDNTTIPMYGVIWRAVLAEGDFSLHIVGSTGEGKTALAALLQQHFGPEMDARHLPANWTSTANSLEAMLFEAKDCLVVLDEYTPTDFAHANTIQRTAERVLRAQANRTGRARLRSDTTHRPAKPPRGFIISTGEDLPKGQSLRARMLVVEIELKSVDFKALTSCQNDAASGLYAEALAGFIKWLAARYDTIHQRWQEELAEIRQYATQSGMHRRTPENIASIALGWRYFLRFAVDIGVFPLEEAERRWQQVWKTLGQVALSQSQHQAAAESTGRFLELLRNAIASGKAHLKPMRSYDYRDSESAGTCIGWIDDDNDRVYLLPDVSYAVAQDLGKAINDPLVIASQTLRKRLKEKGHIAETSSPRGTITVRKTINKRRIEVLALYRASLVTELDQFDQYDHQQENDGNWSTSCPPLVREWSENSSQSDQDNSLNDNDLNSSGQVGQANLTIETGKNTPSLASGQFSSNDGQKLTTKPDRCEDQDTSEVDDAVVPEEVF